MAGPTPKRRWFQFSLASLLLIVTVVVLAIYAVSEHRNSLRLQAEIAAQDAMIQQLKVQANLLQNGSVTLNQQLQWLTQQQQTQAKVDAELRRQQKSAVPVVPK